MTSVVSGSARQMARTWAITASMAGVRGLGGWVETRAGLALGLRATGRATGLVGGGGGPGRRRLRLSTIGRVLRAPRLARGARAEAMTDHTTDALPAVAAAGTVRVVGR